MRESEIERKVVAWSRTKHMLPLKLTPVADGGWPDHFWLFYYPSIAFIEFKAPEGRLALRQKLRIEELQRRGYPVKVIRNVEDGITFLEASCLSGKRSAPWHPTSVRGISNVPRNGEDDSVVCNLQNTEGQEFR